MFKLEFQVHDSPIGKININDHVLTVGSCFADEIGNKLSKNKVKNLTNPFGTIYNPHTIFNLLKGEIATEKIIENQGVFYHWDMHGSISSLTKNKISQYSNNQIVKTSNFLTKSQWIIITLGTASVYTLQDGSIVANCHKMPASTFRKRLLSQQEILDQFSALHSHLLAINPTLRIIFTVSPVRHIKDGLVENNRSKSILIDAVHTICDTYKNISYFPAYEILIDELRDYRFYAEDMIHPSTQAIDYIWNSFSKAYFDEETKTFLQQWKNIYASINHRPFHPTSPEHQKFLRSTLEKVEHLNEKVDMCVEIEQLKKQLNPSQ